jgi:tetrahydromethanopterin S-methyltransferase subunit G
VNPVEDKVFDLLEKMYVEMKQQFEVVNKNFELVNKKLDEKVDKTDIVKIENDLVPKIEALFDGYKQNTEKLDRIEKEVSKQEEIIMQRVK